MNAMSSEEFLTEVVMGFREGFERFAPVSQRLIKERAFDSLPFKPYQIEVLDFGVGKAIIWLLIHDNQLPDMMLKIHKDVKSVQESEFASKYKTEFSVLFEKYYQALLARETFHILTKVSVSVWTIRESYGKPQDIIQFFLRNAKKILRTEQVDSIERSTDGLKESIARIPEEDIREELLSNTNKIDKSLQEIKRIDEEIDKVRQLVGISQEYQDWKLLVSDVHRLKGEHVPREVFDAKMNELNTRINSLGEIKEAYDTIFAQQNQFMKQQADVMKQQSSFMNWIKYSTILVPIVVACVPIIQTLIQHLLGE